MTREEIDRIRMRHLETPGYKHCCWCCDEIISLIGEIERLYEKERKREESQKR